MEMISLDIHGVTELAQISVEIICNDGEELYHERIPYSAYVNVESECGNYNIEKIFFNAGIYDIFEIGIAEFRKFFIAEVDGSLREISSEVAEILALEN